MASQLTKEEAELYDRQIRAWGFEAQRRMRESKILIVGLDGAGSELLKNLVLAGVGNITILDDSIVDQNIIDTHFYVTLKDMNAKVMYYQCNRIFILAQNNFVTFVRLLFFVFFL